MINPRFHSIQSRPAAAFLAALLLASAFGACNAQAQPAAQPRHAFFHVSLDPAFSGPVSGRLLLFVAPPSGDGSAVDIDMMSPESVYVAAKEVRHLAPGQSIDIDADDLVFPRPLSQATAGSYNDTLVSTILF